MINESEYTVHRPTCYSCENGHDRTITVLPFKQFSQEEEQKVQNRAQQFELFFDILGYICRDVDIGYLSFRIEAGIRDDSKSHAFAYLVKPKTYYCVENSKQRFVSPYLFVYHENEDKTQMDATVISLGKRESYHFGYF